VGLQGPNVGIGDTGSGEYQPAKVHCARIAIIQASVLDACNRPTADAALTDLTSAKLPLNVPLH
jgi:hypothetical protein